ncbi:putative pectinesterase/pectinesterase inhibitor 51 [Iris pallida]|uniref:Pectinesterase n=1 Tax=Iris pallida TaxID=29817 RepID=A0AAX6EPT0_IRIPA|nr:putative pectinesterase/pectinesterase inhibitor 51 [Iris pallida]
MHRKPPPKSLLISKPTFLFLSMASFLLLPLLLLLSHSPLPLSSSQQTQTTITQACKSSLFPALCVSTLLSQPPSSADSPSSLILSLLSASSHSLSTALSLSQSLLLSSSSVPSRANAARNCLDHLTLSSLRINSTLPLLPTLADQQTASRARALAGAALLYQYDCWSALKYVNSTRQVASAMSFLRFLTQVTSSALSMIAAAQRYGPDDPSLWSPPQTERDGYWPPHADSDPDPLFPSDLKPDATVCKPPGACDHATVQEAVDAAPDFGPSRFVIHIRSGTYAENVRVAFEKTNVVFVGDGAGRTVVTGSLNAQMPAVTTYNTATVGVFGDGFMARDLTFRNTAGPGSHQAVAFRCDGDRSFLHSVEFLGHQDTLYARSLRQLYVNCTISGTVDFIFGNSAAVFKGCLIQVLPRQESPEKGESDAVTAHGRTDPGQATGFVFEECTVDGSDEYMEIYKRRPTRHKVYLGRPWKEYSRTVFLNCYLGEMVRPEGWMPFRPGFGLKTLFYGEYSSSGPGANVSGRVGWSSQVPEEHLGMYSVRNFLQGDEWALTNQ